MRAAYELDLSYVKDEAERHALEAYDALLYRALRQALPPLTEPLNVLDLWAVDGVFALGFARELSSSCTVVALGDESQSLEPLHTAAAEVLGHGSFGARFFARREDLPRLPFADNVFDLVYACLPHGELPELRGLLTQAFRVLRAEGTIALAMPLAPSFLELAQAVSAESGGTNPGLPPPTHHLAARKELASLADWEGHLARAGFIDVVAASSTITFEVPIDAYQHALYHTRLAPLFVSAEANAASLLAAALTAPLVTTLHLGVLTGLKAMTAPPCLPKEP